MHPSISDAVRTLTLRPFECSGAAPEAGRAPQESPHPPLPANVGAPPASLLTSPAGHAPRSSAQVTYPRPAGRRALQGEGAGVPPHPGAGRPHLARAADAAAPPPRILTPPAGGGRGSPRGAGPFSPPFGRQVVERRPELPACHGRCSVCLSLTWPSGKQAAAVFTLAACERC
jgi:hypothetical protein